MHFVCFVYAICMLGYFSNIIYEKIYVNNCNIHDSYTFPLKCILSWLTGKRFTQFHFMQGVIY